MKLTIVYIAQNNPNMGLAVEQVIENGLIFDGEAGWLKSQTPLKVGQLLNTKKQLTLIEHNGFAKWSL